MPNFQFEIELSGSGYVNVEADNAEAATQKMRTLEFRAELSGIHFDVDTALLDSDLDKRIGKAVEVEEE